MKARPILFSGEMILALFDGRKHMTRRVVKPQPGELDRIWQMQDGTWHQSASDGSHMSPIGTRRGDCPYGQPGDLLWCRETWCNQSEDGCFVGDKAWYRADGIDVVREDGDGYTVFRKDGTSEEDAIAEGILQSRPEIVGPWRCFHSGVDDQSGVGWTPDPTEAFADLWESIHGPGAWERNAWCWVLRFRVIHAKVDAAIRAPAEYGVAAA